MLIKVYLHALLYRFVHSYFEWKFQKMIIDIFVIYRHYTVFFTRLFSTFENDDFFMVTAPTVVPAYKAIMQCTNEQLCYNFNLFLLKLSTWRYMRYIYTNINKCRYSVRGTWTVQIREKNKKKVQMFKEGRLIKKFLA